MRARWSSRLAFIMAATGAAVGLGNIWKFPYMAGENGGGAFVFLYLIFVALIGVPALIAEIMIGRLGRDTPVKALQKLSAQAKASPKWRYLGWWGGLGLVLVLSFYSVIGGFSIGYLTELGFHGLDHFGSVAAVHLFFDAFLANPFNLLTWHTLFMIFTLSVIAFGVRSGLERASNILMPGLFFILFILMIYSIYVGDPAAAINFLLKPQLCDVTAAAALNALGHAFFTLAIGAGAMLVYGAYLPQQTRIGSSICIIAFLDVLVAIFSGLAIFSIVFAYELPVAGGPGLMFKVLPVAFVHMPSGALFGALFFILLLFAAWTSSISMAEPLVVLVMDRFCLKRKVACALIGLLCWILGVLASLSFNVWKDVRIFGHFSVFDAMADLTTNIILPIGGLCFVLFAGWVLKYTDTEYRLISHHPLGYELWRFLVRFIAPVGILLSFVFNLL